MSSSTNELAENLVNRHPALKNDNAKKEVVLDSVKKAYKALEVKGKLTTNITIEKGKTR